VDSKTETEKLYYIMKGNIMTAEPNKTIELETLKGDVAKLANDLKDMIHAVGTQGKEKLVENKQRLESALRTLRGEAKEKLGEAYESLREHGQEAVDLSRKKIEERPLTAVFTALGVGLLVGILIGRRS
jgi:ElaB/YqjD/DUF883 family membrane-anchored ribosome-binding protein